MTQTQIENTRKELVEILTYRFDIPKEKAEELAKMLDTETIYTTIEDRQGGEFGFRSQTELEWAITALEWADSDGFYDIENVEDTIAFLEKQYSGGNLIPYIDDLWEITIVKDNDEKEYYVDIYDHTNGRPLYEIGGLKLSEAKKVFEHLQSTYRDSYREISSSLYECGEEENIVIETKWLQWF